MEPKLDPREVLTHLNKMGYHHISAEQLRDFIKDLKKLIKYDTRQCGCPSEARSNGFSFDEEPPTLESQSYKSKASGRDRLACREIQVPQKERRPKSAFVPSPWRDESDDVSSSSSNLSPAVSSSSIATYDLPLKYHAKGKEKLRCASADNLHEPSKPRASFIKPWRLLEPLPQPRSDPVALYHKYQEIWRLQKAPGESSHQGLRWSVREKMLGQDPNPRPMSRNSSQDAVWRRRKLR